MSICSREFDVIVFGATGYVGQYVTEEIANCTKSTEIKWAVAGRDIQKLRQSLELVQEYLQGIDILNTSIIKADIYDRSSIVDMCKRARLILNCVGPYKIYGETVVSACIESETHHIDLSIEFHYLETTQANYFHAAREKGVYVVQACGFGSIPVDYGSALLKKKFPGDLNSVEFYIAFKEGPSGITTHIGTFLSLIGSVTDLLNFAKFEKMLKEKVFKKEMVKSKHSLSWRLPIFFSDIVKGWCFRFIDPGERITKRSQMFRYEYLNDRSFQSQGYIKVPSLFNAFFLLFCAGLLSFMSLFSFGRYLLAKYPSFFTLGRFSKSGPTRKQIEEGKTIITLVGQGWKYKLSEPTDQHETKPDTTMKLKIAGPEPAYPFTSICMVHAGLVILQEQDKLPLEGGVLTPGVAFENTTLSRRLDERGIKFIFEENV